MGHDPVRLSKTMTFLLRHKPEAGDLVLDEDDAVLIEALAEATSRLLRRVVSADDLLDLVENSRVVRFEVNGDRIRAARERRVATVPPRTKAPDILYHACTADMIQRYHSEGGIRSFDGKPVWLSADEGQAWRAAHRMHGDPRVLIVDTARGRRRRLVVQKHRRSGLYMVRHVPIGDVLNLQPAFAEQLSAGGLPLLIDESGQPKVALIRVTRRSGTTWEVAKGKLEAGEPPEWAGVREVREEMGIDVDFDVRDLIGLVRYGFMAPGGLPRLKTIYLYLLEPRGSFGAFSPASQEGIDDVAWFSPEEACRAVTHASLVPMMRRAREIIRQRYPG
jgi:putative RNA 2'-phosphotransferase